MIGGEKNTCGFECCWSTHFHGPPAWMTAFQTGHSLWTFAFVSFLHFAVWRLWVLENRSRWTFAVPRVNFLVTRSFSPVTIILFFVSQSFSIFPRIKNNTDMLFCDKVHTSQLYSVSVNMMSSLGSVFKSIFCVFLFVFCCLSKAKKSGNSKGKAYLWW